MDSGSVASVVEKGTFPGEVKPSSMSRAGKGFRSASSHLLPNEGEQHVIFGTAEGHKCGLKIQCANVERPLISTADLTAEGHRVCLGEADG